MRGKRKEGGWKTAAGHKYGVALHDLWRQGGEERSTSRRPGALKGLNNVPSCRFFRKQSRAACPQLQRATARTCSAGRAQAVLPRHDLTHYASEVPAPSGSSPSSTRGGTSRLRNRAEWALPRRGSSRADVGFSPRARGVVEWTRRTRGEVRRVSPPRSRGGARDHRAQLSAPRTCA